MRSIVLWLLLFNGLVAAADVAVDGDSNCNEAIQSLQATLVATLDTKFEQLKAEINENCSQGNTTGRSFLVIFVCLNTCCCIFLC